MGTPSKQLYSLEVYVHSLQELRSVATTANPCVAFRLWNFPTLYVQPNLASRATEVVGGTYRTLDFEAGQSCLFAVHPDEIIPHLPLTLHVLFVDERSAAERHVLASQALVVGDREVVNGPGGVTDALRCTIKRGVFPLLDVYHDKIGTMTLDVRLTCLGSTALPHLMPGQQQGGQISALARGAATVGACTHDGRGGTAACLVPAGAAAWDPSQQHVALRGGRRDDAGSTAAQASLDYDCDPPPQAGPRRSRRRRLLPPRDGRVGAAAHPPPPPAWHAAGPSSYAPAPQPWLPWQSHPIPAGPPPGPPPAHAYGGAPYRTPVLPEAPPPEVPGDFSVAKFLRYEVMSQLAALYAMLDAYVSSPERDLGKASQYGEDERGFFSKQLAVMKDVAHSTTRVLQAIDHFIGSDSLGVVRRSVGGELAPAAAQPCRAAPPPRAPDLRVGDRVRARDMATEAWSLGTVTSVGGRDGAEIQPDGIRGRSFTFAIVELLGPSAAPAPPTFKMDQRVRARRGPGAPWQEGNVDACSADGVHVIIDGMKRADVFPASHVEAISEKSSDSKRDEKDNEREREREKEREKEKEMEKEKEKDRDKEKEKEKEEEEKSRDKEKEKEKERDSGKDKEESGGKDKDKDTDKDTGMRVGDPVRMRDQTSQPWRQGVITEIDKEGVHVKPDGGMRSFCWNYVESLGDKGGKDEKEREKEKEKEKEKDKSFSVGQKVRVRDSDREQWRGGEVTGFSGDKPVVKITGGQRGFTWAFVEPDDGGDDAKKEESKKDGFAVGDRVKVRDSDREQWRTGVIDDVSGSRPKVKCDGQSRSFVWNYVERLDSADSGSSSAAKSDGKPKEGDRVRVRDTDREQWREGTVTGQDSQGRTKVRTDGAMQAFTWNQVEPIDKTGGASSAKFRSGDRVRVRDTQREAWREGTVSEVKSDGRPLVKADGATRAFGWEYVEMLDEKGKDEKKDELREGDKVRMRDTESEQWKNGVVTAVTGGRPMVKQDGASRAFTWGFVEKAASDDRRGSTGSSAKFSRGDRVRMRDSERETWKQGEVVDFVGDKPKVKADGAQRAFTWNHVEHLSGSDAKSSGSEAIKVGDRVRMRDTATMDWKKGVVESFSGSQARIRADGEQRVFTWEYVEKLSDPGPDEPKPFKEGDKVQMRDSEREAWKKGVVTGFSGTRPTCKADGASRAFTWQFVEAVKEESSKKETFNTGDKVQVRDTERETWKRGEVSGFSGSRPLVKIEGSSRAFTWNFVEGVGGGSDSGKSDDKYRLGEKVRVRDSSREEWKNGEVTGHTSEGKPIVKAEGTGRAFTWQMVERRASVDQSSARPSPRPGLKVGDRVRVRDTEREQWKPGEVTDFQGDRPKVKTDGAQRAFTWNFVEPVEDSRRDDFRVHDRVRMRDTEREAWSTGEVTGFSGTRPLVKADGANRPFTWTFVEKADSGGGSDAGKGDGGGKLSQGDRAKVRDSEREAWKEGVVEGFDGERPKVRCDGASRAFTWAYVEPAGGGAASSSSSAPPSFAIDDRVRVRDTDREQWKEGAVTGFSGSRPLVKVDGNSRAFTWAFVEKAGGGGGSGGRSDDRLKEGDRARVRDTEREAWKTGTVSSFQNGQAVVKVDGHTRAFLWKYTEKA